jgi:ubiquinone/menaquinone biosynthesis C-methylase UbiE
VRLNWAERWVVNNPLRAVVQGIEIRLLKEHMETGSRSRFLEIGCGRGAGARLILRDFAPETLIASDLDTAMLVKAARYLSADEQRRILLSAADVLSLPFREGTFDVVFGFGVLHHVPDWRPSMAEVWRVIRPGGIYFLEEIYPSLYQNALTKHILLHPTEDRFRSGDLKQEWARSGFSLVAAREVKRVGIVAVLRKAEARPPAG